MEKERNKIIADEGNIITSITNAFGLTVQNKCKIGIPPFIKAVFLPYNF